MRNSNDWGAIVQKMCLGPDFSNDNLSYAHGYFFGINNRWNDYKMKLQNPWHIDPYNMEYFEMGWLDGQGDKDVD